MPSWKIEMDGDGDTTIKDFAVEFAADHTCVAEVTLGPGEGRDVTSAVGTED